MFITGSKPYVIRSLEHETQYVVRVAAGSDVGYGNYSQEKFYKLVKEDVSSIAPTPMPHACSLIYVIMAVAVIHFCTI